MTSSWSSGSLYLCYCRCLTGVGLQPLCGADCSDQKVEPPHPAQTGVLAGCSGNGGIRTTIFHNGNLAILITKQHKLIQIMSIIANDC